MDEKFSSAINCKLKIANRKSFYGWLEHKRLILPIFTKCYRVLSIEYLKMFFHPVTLQDNK